MSALHAPLAPPASPDSSDASRALLARLDEVMPLLLAPSPLKGWGARAEAAQGRLAALADEVRAARRPLVVLLLGGTGVGKSSLLNALAGEEVSPASRGRRAFTSAPQVYHHAAVPLAPLALPAPFEAHPHAVEALRDKLVIDAPDLDSTEREHRRRVEALLPRVDVVIYVTSWQKYRDRALNEVVASLRGAHSFVFALNQLDSVDPPERAALKEDFERALREVGFAAPEALPLSAEAALLQARGAPADEEGAAGVAALRALLWESLRRVEVEGLKALSATQRAARELALLPASCDLGPAAGEGEPLARAARALSEAARALDAERAALDADLAAALEATAGEARARIARALHARRAAGVGGPYGLYLLARAWLEARRPAAAAAGEAARLLNAALLRAAERASALAWAHPAAGDPPPLGREEARRLADALDARLEEAALRAAPAPRSALQLNAAPAAAAAALALLYARALWGGGDPGLVGLLLGAGALYGVCAAERALLEAVDGTALSRGARLDAEGLGELLELHGPGRLRSSSAARLREAAERARALHEHARALREAGEALSARPAAGALRYLHA
ncbi:MAG: hypothetical protein FJ138_08835 [Deltaproteobacteria bacterium]|nr:hypothetical protein [Deltaproteobacteria bacterium]